MQDYKNRNTNRVLFICSELLPAAVLEFIVATLFEDGFSKREVKSYVRRLVKDKKMQLFHRLLAAYGGDAYISDSLRLCQSNSKKVRSVMRELRIEGVIEKEEDDEDSDTI